MMEDQHDLHRQDQRWLDDLPDMIQFGKVKREVV